MGGHAREAFANAIALLLNYNISTIKNWSDLETDLAHKNSYQIISLPDFWAEIRKLDGFLSGIYVGKSEL